jgi:hypothetical protein
MKSEMSKWYSIALVALVALSIFVYLLRPTSVPAGEVWALDEIDDPAFKGYMLTVLWPRCPYYQDGGAVYRDCLWKARDEAKAAYRGQDGAEIESYCQDLGGRFEGLLAGEMALSCEAFRFSHELVP